MADISANQLMMSTLAWAIRLYPAEKREWGEAILAEADTISGFGAALSWTLGGLMVALRAYFSRLLGGRTANGPVGMETKAPPPPIRWKFVILYLAITGALLLVPEMREGLGVTFDTWREQFLPDRDPFRGDTAAWQRIGREAENRGDAETMALAATWLSRGNNAQFEEAVTLAEKAVAKDANLTWVYSFLSERNSDRWVDYTLRPELATQLQAWDPQNAVGYLLEANAVVRRHKDDPLWAGLPGFAPLTMDSVLRSEDLARLRRRDPRWRELMDRALAAPKYDDYYARRMQLQASVLQRLGKIDSSFGVAAMKGGFFPVPPLGNLRDYAAIRLEQGREAERAGHWEEAASEYWALLQFGQRLHLSGWRESWMGRDLQEATLNRLQQVLLKLGRPEEARVVANESQLLAAEAQQWGERVQLEWRRLSSFSNEGTFLLHFCFLTVVASGIFVIIALSLFCVTRGRSRFVSSTLAWAPLLLALGCVGVLLAFQPYAEFYRMFLANPGTQDLGWFMQMHALDMVPEGVYFWVAAVGPRLFWWSVIALGSAICIWRISRAAFWTVRPQSA